MRKINRIMAGMCLLSITVVALAGCGTSSGATETDAANAVTENKEWPSKIAIAQMPNENNPDSGTKHEGFRLAMEEYLGIEVEVFEGSDYSVGIEAMKSGKLDIQLVSPMSYYQAQEVAGAEPLVTTTSMGAEEYKTVFITKSDRDDINSIEDLKGKTFAFVDPASSSGYMYPKTLLVTSLELDPEQLENPGYFFETVTYSGKHDASLMGVTMGDYDAAAVAYGTIKPMAEAGLINEDDIKIIGETEIIPNACFVIRGDLPQTLKDKIKEFYLQYKDDNYFEILYADPETRFIETFDSDYEMVAEMVKILKIEE